MKKTILSVTIVILTLFILLESCNRPGNSGKKAAPKQRKAPAENGFHFVKPKQWLTTGRTDFNDPKKQHIILAVNRIDSAHFLQMDSVLIPNDLSGDLEYYLPFPFTVPSIGDVKKAIFFSYQAQAFGAYENGELVYTGPTSMGRKHDPTPTGLFYSNWKAEQTTSTFNDEWDLRWNFNIESKLGVGWHQYAMPGYPASHSCLRLQEWDARYLYKWADQWVLDKNENIKQKGTPVIVFGNYNFNGPRPWLQLAANTVLLKISADQLSAVAAPYLAEIIKAQRKSGGIK